VWAFQVHTFHNHDAGFAAAFSMCRLVKLTHMESIVMSNSETMTPTTLSEKDILKEMRSLGLASWVLKTDVSILLKSTGWVDGAKIILRSFDDKDRDAIMEQAQAHIRVNIKEEAGGEVVCAFLRLAAMGLGSEDSERAASADNKAVKPAENRRQRGARTQGAAGNTRSAANEASSSGEKRTRNHYSQEQKAEVLADLESGKDPEVVAAERGINPNTIISWNTQRKRAAAARNGNQGQTPTGNNQAGDESGSSSSGSPAPPATGESSTPQDSSES
jgi:hypothetical protein